MIFFYCSLTICTLTIALTLYLFWSFKKIRHLKAQEIVENLPPVAVIIAVRNEEDDLANALESVCNLNYPDSRIIVVNDRSTDKTAEILQEFKLKYPRITVTTVTELPDGWLGKNNALYQGYLSSTEEWMLFTDADIEFHPDALAKAMSYAVANQLDHLAILPKVVSRSPVLNSVLATFTIMLMLHLRPWEARKPKLKGYVGIGAFNLVRRTAYEKIGTHAAIKLRPDDDLQLGFKIKRAGLRQDVLVGGSNITLEWYKNLRQFSNGLLKNSFSVANYSISEAVANVCLMLISTALPLPLMFIFGTTAIRLMACVMLVTHIIYMSVSPNKWWYAFMIPFAGFFMAYTTLRAMVITLKQGGVYWRDSFYSLAMLKGKE